MELVVIAFFILEMLLQENLLASFVLYSYYYYK